MWGEAIILPACPAVTAFASKHPLPKGFITFSGSTYKDNQMLKYRSLWEKFLIHAITMLKPGRQESFRRTSVLPSGWRT